MQQLSETQSKEEWMKSAEKLADQRADDVRLQIASEAMMKLNDESRAQLETERLTGQLSNEEAAASEE